MGGRGGAGIVFSTARSMSKDKEEVEIIHIFRSSCSDLMFCKKWKLSL